MSKKVIVNGMNIGYLPPTNASEINYDMGGGNYTTVQDIIEDLDLTHGGTIAGDLVVNSSSENVSRIVAGDSTTDKIGILRLFNNGRNITLKPTTITANHDILLPNLTGTLALTSDITVQRYRAQVGTQVSSIKIPIKNDSSYILNGILFSRVWQDPNYSTPMNGSIWWISIRPSNGTSGFKAILTDSSSTQTHISSVSYSTSEEMLTINFSSSATRFCEFIWG